jgi:transposase
MPPVESILAENEKLKDRLSKRESRIAELEAQIAWLRRQIFAGGKSEKIDPAQLELMLKGLQEQKAALDTQKETISYERSKPSKRKSRQENYENLPVLEEKIIEPEEVKADPDAWQRIGEEETFEIKVDPPKFYRCKIIRPKYRSKDDKSRPPVVAPSPPRVVEGLASTELLIYIVTSKYLDHLPLYRQRAIYKRYGFTVPRQNLVRWVEKVAQWLKPIYNHMGQELLNGDYLQADETPIKYCDPDYGEKKTRQGYLCGYSRPAGNVYYRWSPSRAHQKVTAFLEGYQGLLQSDAYDAYIQFAARNEGVILIGCMAHARRRFYEAQDQHPRESALVLKLIARLYQVEKYIRETPIPLGEISQYRQKHALNTHKRLKRVLEILRHRTLPKSQLGKACSYALNHWTTLTHYLDHDQVAIDNNAMENAIRPTAIGKKNWLFVGHPQAGERAAILYSILISCQRLEININDYLKDVLSIDTRVLDEDQRAALTPERWKKAIST